MLDPEAVAPPAAYAAQLGQVAAFTQGEPNTLSTFAEAYAVQEVVETLLAADGLAMLGQKHE